MIQLKTPQFLRNIFKRFGAQRNLINLYGSDHIVVDFSELYDEEFAPIQRPEYKVEGDTLFDPVSGLRIPLIQLAYKAYEPDDVRFRVTAFDVALAKKDYGTAEAMMDKILKKNPENVGAAIDKAIVLSLKGDHKAAYELNSKVLEKHPDNYAALHNRAIVLIDLNRPEEALKDIQKAIGNDKEKFIPSYYTLGKALWMLGRKEESYDALEAGLSIKKTGVFAEQHHKMLARVVGCDNPADALKKIQELRAELKSNGPPEMVSQPAGGAPGAPTVAPA